MQCLFGERLTIPLYTRRCQYLASRRPRPTEPTCPMRDITEWNRELHNLSVRKLLLKAILNSRIRIQSMSIVVVHPAPCRLGQHVHATGIIDLTYMKTGDGKRELEATQTGTD